MCRGPWVSAKESWLADCSSYSGNARVKYWLVMPATLVVLVGLGQVSASIVVSERNPAASDNDPMPGDYWDHIAMLNQGGFLYELDGSVTPNVVDYTPQGIYWTLYYGDLLGAAHGDENVGPPELPLTAETRQDLTLYCPDAAGRFQSDRIIHPVEAMGQTDPPRFPQIDLRGYDHLEDLREYGLGPGLGAKGSSFLLRRLNR